MKDCYCDLGLHFILLDDPSQSYILKLRDRALQVLHLLRYFRGQLSLTICRQTRVVPFLPSVAISLSVPALFQLRHGHSSPG